MQIVVLKGLLIVGHQFFALNLLKSFYISILFRGKRNFFANYDEMRLFLTLRPYFQYQNRPAPISCGRWGLHFCNENMLNSILFENRPNLVAYCNYSQTLRHNQPSFLVRHNPPGLLDKIERTLRYVGVPIRQNDA